MVDYWYNTSTGEVEEGPKSLGSDRVGPFPDRASAAKAPETLKANAAKWAEEDAREDD
jgi:hypothetical protein